MKNIGLQLQALARVAEKVPHVRLRIMGDGPLKASLKLQVKSLKLEDKVFLKGIKKTCINTTKKQMRFCSPPTQKDGDALCLKPRRMVCRLL